MILLAVLLAQALDALTWALLPPGAEANPAIAHMNTVTAWVVKLLLVEAVFLLSYALPRLPHRFRWTPPIARLTAETLVVTAIAAGFLGAGANLSVLLA